MGPEEFAAQRHTLVEKQLRARRIHDPRVLAAFETVPRHVFVLPGDQNWAYTDSPLSIGYEQTISQPYIVALMTQALKLTGSERVLEVGTGSGYQAAILARLAAEVHSVEIIPALAERSRAILEQLEVKNLQIHLGDGSLGWPEAAPYDAILVTAAAPRVPQPLLEQLTPHGRLILPVGASGFQRLELWQRTEKDFAHEEILPVAFVLLRGQHGWPKGG